MWSPSPVVKKNHQPCTRAPRRPRSLGPIGSDGSEDKQGRREERHHPVARTTSDQEEDRGDEEGLRPEQEQAMGTEPSADLAWLSLMGWTSPHSPRSVTCPQEQVPWSASRGLQPEWSRPPLSADSRHPKLWRSSWVVGMVSGTATGAAR